MPAMSPAQQRCFARHSGRRTGYPAGGQPQAERRGFAGRRRPPPAVGWLRRRRREAPFQPGTEADWQSHQRRRLQYPNALHPGRRGRPSRPRDSCPERKSLPRRQVARLRQQQGPPPKAERERTGPERAWPALPPKAERTRPSRLWGQQTPPKTAGAPVPRQRALRRPASNSERQRVAQQPVPSRSSEADRGQAARGPASYRLAHPGRRAPPAPRSSEVLRASTLARRPGRPAWNQAAWWLGVRSQPSRPPTPGVQARTGRA